MGWESWGSQGILPTTPRGLVSLLYTQFMSPLLPVALTKLNASLSTLTWAPGFIPFLTVTVLSPRVHFPLYLQPSSIWQWSAHPSQSSFCFLSQSQDLSFLLIRFSWQPSFSQTCPVHSNNCEMSSLKWHLKVTKSKSLILLLGKLGLPERLPKVTHQRAARTTEALATSYPWPLDTHTHTFSHTPHTSLPTQQIREGALVPVIGRKM